MFLVLGIVLSSLGSFALVAYPRDDRATEAAMKYFVYGSVTGGVMIFGLTFWYGGSGSTLLMDLGQLDGRPLAAIAGFIAAVIGLGYKAALAPLHFWAPDAYEGAPVVTAAYLSIVPKVGAVFALAVIGQYLRTGLVDWRAGLAALSILSMTYGNLAALVQTNVVRLLAYSSIAQSGYFLIGMVAIGRDALAVHALVAFAAAYAAMNLGAFAVAQAVGSELTLYRGVGRSRIAMGAAMTLFLFSLVGIPPMAGFFGKVLLFGAAIETGYAWLAVAGILNSVLSLAVYLRIVVPMYEQPDVRRPVHRHPWLVWSAALTLTLGIGLLTELFTAS